MVREEHACPKCGGPMPLETVDQASTCRFCHATVVPRRVERASADQAESAPLCPRCSKPLTDVRSGAKVVGVCERCGGAWVDLETVSYLTRVSDADLEVTVRRALGVVVSLGAAARQASVFCPICGKQAARCEIAGTANCLDRCEEHGVWFDRDELEMFVKSQADARAGEVSASDVPLQEGFFTRLFRALTG